MTLLTRVFTIESESLFYLSVKMLDRIPNLQVKILLTMTFSMKPRRLLYLFVVVLDRLSNLCGGDLDDPGLVCGIREFAIPVIYSDG